jgi:hypothetical protein
MRTEVVIPGYQNRSSFLTKEGGECLKKKEVWKGGKEGDEKVVVWL